MDKVKRFTLVDDPKSGSASGINFTPQPDGSVEVVFWEVSQGTPSSGPSSRSCSELMSRREARETWRDAISREWVRTR